MKTKNKVLINIIGTGYEISVCEPSPELCQKLLREDKEDRSASALLLDESFYESFKCPETIEKKNLSWKNLNNKGMFRGANLNERGQLEIWMNRKRIKTYAFQELMNEAVLFPLFDSEELFLKDVLSDAPAFLIGIQEKGQQGKYYIRADRFNPEEFRLHLIRFQSSGRNIRLLHKISYAGESLHSLKDDTLVTGSVFNWLIQ